MGWNLALRGKASSVAAGWHRWHRSLGRGTAARLPRRRDVRWFAIYRTPNDNRDTTTRWVVEHHVKVAPWIARLKPAWDLLRKDRSKVLTKEEFLTACPRALPEIVDGLYAIFDMHPRNGEISYTEMCAYVLFAGDRGSAEEKIEAIFPICDLDGHGVISFEELKNALNMLYWARFKDHEYVTFKVDKIMDEVRAHAVAAAEEGDAATAGTDGDTPPEAKSVELLSAESGGKEEALPAQEADAACQALAGRPLVAASHLEVVSDAAARDAAAAAAGSQLDAPSREPSQEKRSQGSAEDSSSNLTLRQFTLWARSDLKHVSELRELLGQPIVSTVEAGEDDEFETFSMQAHMVFERIQVDHPVVELDGDEMTRIIWHMIKEKLIFPFLDMDIDYYDLSITYRDDTEDEVTHEAAAAIQRHHVGIKCPTISPDQARVMEFNLRNMWKSPNVTLQNTLEGTVFHVPVVTKNIPQYVPGWKKPIIIGRHAHADQFKAAQLSTGADRPGTFKLVFETEDGEVEKVATHTFTHNSEGGVMMCMYNTRKSVKDFARCCFEYALSQGMPLYLSTKNNILETYDGLFTDVFSNMYDSVYKKTFEERGLWYQHRIIDDMVSQVMKSSGGFVWACKNYDGDMLSDVVAQGYGSLGLMTTVLVCPDGKTVLTQAGHGTVTRHYRAFQRGESTSTNPIACIFAWTRGLSHRAKLDGNDRLAQFSQAVEEAAVTCVQSGQMSKDLATCAHGEQVSADHWLLTEDLLDAIANELRIVLGKGLRSEPIAQEVPFNESKREKDASQAPSEG